VSLSSRAKGKSRRALGKGLGALIPGAGKGKGAAPGREYFLCPVDRIARQSDQPRKSYDKQALEQLVESIRERGVIQPLVVRRRGDGSGYELIAGERRWRAAQLAGLLEVPVVIKDVTDAEAFEIALIENIQREDLNPLEEAVAFQQMIDDSGYTQAEVAQRIGCDRTTVTNRLRLLGLPKAVKQLVLDGQLSEGHARAVLQAGKAQVVAALARKAVAEGLSVRETERRARALSKGGGSGAATRAARSKLSPQVRSLVEKLQRALGARVKIVDKKGKGKLEITYTSYGELDGILDRILK
jgi:ParB family chromosome partitioning protein